ncbi:hypothetical protein [Geobacter pickeringii]|uniref:DNA-binding protein n=1 Tax=Geobacter pickeringii TaxID=345632 RepID=A0A0B5BC34_9BACT|nr:hypothetical protein [Geobacter pickeringii]AJE02110.1 DNA-binding protein [Geobacter pickeringii]
MKALIRLLVVTLVPLTPLAAQGFGHMADPSAAEGAPAAGAEVPSTPLSGKVVETANMGGYTYICLEKDGKKVWAAIPEAPVAVGREISLKPGMEMKNFESKGLKRTFESIYFSEGVAVKPADTTGKSSAGSKANVVSPTEKISVEKASGPNAYTVAEIHQQKGKLDGKKAVVRGKVTKVAAGIMDRNWVHLQDGSGDTKKGTHDLTVTSQDLPAVGDVVTASGTLRKNKDFGGGYKYEVIMEEGSIKP